MAKSRKKSKTADAPFAAPAWPKHVGEKWPLNKIKPYPNNPRLHPAEQISLLAQLMTKYGPDQPIVVDEKGIILKGHGRLLAAKICRFEEFPVVQHLGLLEEDKRAIRIADNQVALLSDWNPELLKFEISDLKIADFDISLLGFDTKTLRDIDHGLGDFAVDAPQNRGGLLELVNVTVADPKHVLEHGDHYILSARHHLLCDSVIEDWKKWSPLLVGDALFCPYPGVFVPFSSKAEKHPLVMVQPDPYVAGHILDRYAEIRGAKSITKESA